MSAPGNGVISNGSNLYANRLLKLRDVSGLNATSPNNYRNILYSYKGGPDSIVGLENGSSLKVQPMVEPGILGTGPAVEQDIITQYRMSGRNYRMSGRNYRMSSIHYRRVVHYSRSGMHYWRSGIHYWRSVIHYKRSSIH